MLDQVQGRKLVSFRLILVHLSLVFVFCLLPILQPLHHSFTMLIIIRFHVCNTFPFCLFLFACFYLILLWGPHMAVLRTYTQLSTQVSLMMGFGGPDEVLGIKIRLATCKTTALPSILFLLSSPIYIQLSNSTYSSLHHCLWDSPQISPNISKMFLCLTLSYLMVHGP